jgi:imidazolonepropionase-like amidohydrolase
MENSLMISAFQGHSIEAMNLSKFLLSLAMFSLLTGRLMANDAAMPSGSFVITHVRVFDGEKTLQDQTVVVSKGKIERISREEGSPERWPRIDGSGRTLLPGLIDAHVHAYPENALREAEALGVTTVLDMFSPPDMIWHAKMAGNTGAGLAGADIYSAGLAATVPGGHGTEYGLSVPTITNASEAEKWVDARIAEGSDYIKIILEDGTIIGHPIPTLDRPTFDALVAAAHKRHKLAVCHVGTYQEAREAVEDGADGLMHLFVDKMPEAGFGKFVAEHHVFVVPTLSVLMSVTSDNEEGKLLAADERMANYLSAEDVANLKRAFNVKGPTHYEAAVESIRQLKAAGAKILAGTDAPNPGTEFGASMHGELELLVKAGLTPEEALRAGTSRPAECFGLTDRGRVAAGKRADLLLVMGDPTTNIRDTRNIVAVWKSGKVDDRASLAAETAEAKKAASASSPAMDVGDGVISSFEDGKVGTAFGKGWSKSTDALYGGKSTTDYEVVTEGANGTKKSLQVTGEIVVGLQYNWAGAMFSPGAYPFAPVNLSKATGLQFWAKGDGKTYRVMYFTASGGYTPQVETFVAGTAWKHYSFPFSKFGGSDGHDVQAILFSGGPEIGKFSFQIDEVGLVVKQ